MSDLAQINHEPQTQASDPAVSAWVSANAGSGKTHVLVNRVVRLMLNGTSPERVLCLTYTRAAAAEMSRRLYDELAGWIALDDVALLKRIHEHTGHITYEENQLAAARQLFARALETPGGLKVQTIHAFCERLLQRFPVEAGMVPGFEVMDEHITREVLAQARSQVLAEARAEPGGPTAQNLAMIVGFTSADRFEDLLNDLLDNRHELSPFLNNKEALAERLSQLSQQLGLSEGDTEECIIEAVADRIDVAGYRQAAANLGQCKLDTDLKFAGNIERLLSAGAAGDKFAVLQTMYLTSEGRARSESRLITKGAKTEYPDTHDFIVTEFARVVEATDRLRACRVFEATSALMEVGLQIIRAYETGKRRRGLSDYNDLISKTRELLEEKHASLWVLYKLDGGLDHVLIDEAQDTSPQQWSIIARLTEEFFAGEGANPETERTVFVVGDYKQSIFSFQGADPAEFAHMQGHFRSEIIGAGAKLAEVPLLASFRSTPEVLKAVDEVFSQPLANIGLKDMSDGVPPHTARRIGQAGLVELWPLMASDDKDSETVWRAPRRIDAGSHPRLKLARQIADTIHHWISSGEELTPRGRPVRYSDILILVRQRTTFMDAMVRALKLAGIPVAGADRLELTKHIAVQDLMALARFVLLPEDDLTLASVLKSPLVARDDGLPIDDDDLYALAHDRGKSTVWQRLEAAAEDGAPYKGALKALQAWRSRAGFATPYQFYSQVLISDRGRKALLRRLGTEASDPIDAFLAEALNFQAGHTPSLHDFLGWLEGASLQIKRDMDHSANEVRIMTVHGAKGLEANVVILPDTIDVPDARKMPEVMFWDAGGGTALPLWRLRARDEMSLTSRLKEQHSARMREEYCRLLYVAMTRARDRLYICGYTTRNEAKPESWYGLVSEVLARPEHLAEDGIWRIEGEQTAKAEDRPEEARLAAEAIEAPAWARRHPDAEAASLRWFVPSKLGADIGDVQSESDERIEPPVGGAANDRFQRGNLIHKLLQILPDLPVEDRDAAGRRYLASQVKEDAEDILAEVMAVLDDPAFAPVFAPGSLAEVPLAAQLDFGSGSIGLTGQIDRLVVTESDVLIVDYKTNRPAPSRIEAADRSYIRQLAAYRAALKGLYPDKTVRAALLWTNTAKLMEIPQEMLDGAF